MGIKNVPKVRANAVIVGGGIAGLTAAVTAGERGLKVTVLERASREERGGNSKHTRAYFLMKDENTLAGDWLKDADELSGGLTDKDTLKIVARDAVKVTRWLKTLGIKFERHQSFALMAGPEDKKIRPIGGGKAILEKLERKALDLDVRFHYQNTALELIIDGTRSVKGVRAMSTTRNTLVDYLGEAVVLASGGFEGNQRMLASYLGPSAYHLRDIAPSTRLDTGEGIQMALAIGAQHCGEYGNYHGEILDPRSTKTEPLIMAYPMGIVVDSEGRRFFDEGSNWLFDSMEDLARRIALLPHGIAYFIYDERISRVPFFNKGIRTDQPPISGRTLGELAKKLGLRVDVLKTTVSTYNSSIRKGSSNYSKLDGRKTIGIEPPKSNWAEPLLTGPFYAYPLAAAIVFTFGGLKVDSNASVLDSSGNPIMGLFAAGEIVGLYHRKDPGGQSVLKALALGRIAGRKLSSTKRGRR